MNLLTRRVHILDNALKLTPDGPGNFSADDIPDLIKKAHDHLLEGLQKRTKNGEFIHEPPDWEPFPIARNFFTQRFP